MSYLVFARKYRPQKFEDLIGQDPIARTLKNAITSGKTAHAYIFSGPRGVGKTTTARIFAKALNCLKGPAAEPCGECRNCTEITDGSSLDVLEIDGASNRGIDDIRSLRDNVKFTPANSRYKIYIIDEAHQITHDAFNALLKTLEEPPAHVIFMLATTEQQKVPLTILSRCQRYRFRLIPFDEISRYLSKIALQEGFKIADEALALMVRAAAGSLRDGLSLMDQIASFSGSEIKADDVQYVLGYLPRTLLTGFAESLADRQPQKVLEQVGVISEEGYDLHQFAVDLQEYYRKLLIVASGNEPNDESSEQINSMRVLAKKIGTPEIIRNMRLLSRCLDELRWSEHTRLVLELYAARLAEPYVDLQALAAGLEAAPSPLPRLLDEPSALAEKKSPAVNEPIKNFEVTPPAGGDYWAAALHEIEQLKPSVFACIKEAHAAVSAQDIKLICPKKYSADFIKRNTDYLSKIIEKHAGKKITIIIEVDESKKIVPVEQETKEEPAGPAALPADEVIHHPEDDPGVKKVLDVFPGRLIF